MEPIYDLVIIGGGSNGPAIQLTAQHSGIGSSVLVERGSIGRGVEGHLAANEASSRFVQAGLKHVRDDLRTVWANAMDSRLMKAIGGELVYGQELVIPVYREYEGIYSMTAVWDIYLSAYDRYSRLAGHPSHRMLSPEAMREFVPALRGDINGGATFHEWFTEPSQLSRRFVEMAAERGGTVMERSRVIAFETEPCSGGHRIRAAVVRRDDGSVSRVRGRYFVNACGAWAPSVARMLGIDLRLRPTKGASIIIDQRLTEHPVILFDEQRQYLAALPIGGTTVVGPTNIELTEAEMLDPDLVHATEEEVRYLLDLVASRFGLRLRPEDVDTRFGIRPQLNHTNVPIYHITHLFGIFDGLADGIVNFATIAGGKMSSQLRMAREVVELACKHLGMPFIWGLLGNTATSLSSEEIEMLEQAYRKRCGLRLRSDQKVNKEAAVGKIAARLNLLKHALRYAAHGTRS